VPARTRKTLIRPANGSGQRLEDERGVGRVAGVDLRPLLLRRRHALHEQIEQRRRAEALRRDPACDRVQLVARDRVLERVRDLLVGEGLAVEVALHQPLVGLDDGVEQLLAVLRDRIGHVRGDLDRISLAPALGARVGLHVEQVDDARQLVLGPDRQLDRDAMLGQLLAQRGERAVEVGPLAVEHVDEDDARELPLARRAATRDSCSPRRPSRR